MLRFFYKSFDKVFVLNSEHREWLTGSQMNLEKKPRLSNRPLGEQAF